MFKKGQAAMEFLMTYGWAILVVLVAIGALAYFGVLNPSRFLPSSCTVGPGIGCDDFQVKNTATTDTINLLLRNGLGQDLTVVTAQVGNAGCSDLPAVNWADGQQLNILLTCTAVPAVGTRFKEKVYLKYTTPGNLIRNATGDIVTRVES